MQSKSSTGVPWGRQTDLGLSWEYFPPDSRSYAARRRRQTSAGAFGANIPELFCQKLCQMKYSKTATDEVGHFDEERAAVAAEAGFELVGEGVVSVASQIVVVAGVERRARIRRPSEQELPAHLRAQCAVVNTRPSEEEAGELIARPPRIDVVVECHAPGVVSLQTTLRVVEREAQSIGRFVGEIPIEVQ